MCDFTSVSTRPLIVNLQSFKDRIHCCNASRVIRKIHPPDSMPSVTDSLGQDASASQVPSQQCWYSFAAEYILRQIGVNEIA